MNEQWAWLSKCVSNEAQALLSLYSYYLLSLSIELQMLSHLQFENTVVFYVIRSLKEKRENIKQDIRAAVIVLLCEVTPHR